MLAFLRVLAFYIAMAALLTWALFALGWNDALEMPGFEGSKPPVPRAGEATPPARVATAVLEKPAPDKPAADATAGDPIPKSAQVRESKAADTEPSKRFSGGIDAGTSAPARTATPAEPPAVALPAPPAPSAKRVEIPGKTVEPAREAPRPQTSASPNVNVAANQPPAGQPGWTGASGVVPPAARQAPAVQPVSPPPSAPAPQPPAAKAAPAPQARNIEAPPASAAPVPAAPLPPQATPVPPQAAPAPAQASRARTSRWAPQRRIAGFGADDLVDMLEDTRRTPDDVPCIVFRGLAFAAGTARPLVRTAAEIDVVAKVLNEVSGHRIEIGSRLGPGRPMATDARLRSDRVRLIRDVLIGHGVKPERLLVDQGDVFERVAEDVGRAAGTRVQSIGLCVHD